jgi:uncharacterized peroxidase-related enzyme
MIPVRFLGPGDDFSTAMPGGLAPRWMFHEHQQGQSRSTDGESRPGEHDMALVSYISDQDAAEKIKPVFEGMEKKIGVVPNVFRAMAHNPEMLEAFLALNATLPKTQLDGKLRELAYIKTSELNGCDYCLHHHRALGKKAGLTDRQIADTAIFESIDAYDELQRDVMRFAEQVTRHINVDDALFARLKQALDDRQIVELAMTVGIANFTNRVTETLRLDLPYDFRSGAIQSRSPGRLMIGVGPSRRIFVGS